MALFGSNVRATGESHAEFNYLIESIDKEPQALAALDHLRLAKLFTFIKQHHARLDELAHDMSTAKARRAQMPKVQSSSRQLRQAVRVLLTLMNFDLQHGQDTYREIMGQIAKLIDSSGSGAHILLVSFMFSFMVFLSRVAHLPDNSHAPTQCENDKTPDENQNLLPARTPIKQE